MNLLLLGARDFSFSGKNFSDKVGLAAGWGQPPATCVLTTIFIYKIKTLIYTRGSSAHCLGYKAIKKLGSGRASLIREFESLGKFCT